jgi:hypothetical protein
MRTSLQITLFAGSGVARGVAPSEQIQKCCRGDSGRSAATPLGEGLTPDYDRGLVARLDRMKHVRILGEPRDTPKGGWISARLFIALALMAGSPFFFAVVLRFLPLRFIIVPAMIGMIGVFLALQAIIETTIEVHEGDDDPFRD